MTEHPLWRRTFAEFLGTGLLVTAIVGSGIAAQRLSTDVGLQLFENVIAISFALGVLIVLLGPVSGAHFNPVVSLMGALLDRNVARRQRSTTLIAYVPAQLVGAIVGAVLANAMFSTPTTLSTTERASAATLLAEIVATAGLLLVIVGLSRAGRPLPVIAVAVAAYIAGASWFTSSASFANPAVTLGRVFSDTFAGIAPASVLPFMAAQVVGVGVAIGLAAVLFPVAATSGDSAPVAPAPEVVA